MPENNLPKIMTLKEIATYLKVDEDAVLNELENDRLHGFKVGDQWRCSDAELLAYICGEWKLADSQRQKSPRVNPVGAKWEVVEIAPFDFNWPKTGGGHITEHYDKAFEATRDVNGTPLTFKLGFGNRDVAVSAVEKQQYGTGVEPWLSLPAVTIMRMMVFWRV